MWQTDIVSLQIFRRKLDSDYLQSRLIFQNVRECSVNLKDTIKIREKLTKYVKKVKKWFKFKLLFILFCDWLVQGRFWLAVTIHEARAMQLPEPSESGMPIFLENSPQTICDQILWLVKNANLDFQLKETPFSINLSLKKRFAHHWNPSQFQRIVTPDQNFPNPFSSQTFNKAQETFQETFRTQNSPEPHLETQNLEDTYSTITTSSSV